MTNTDFDPSAVPVRPAATIMLIDDRPDLQVLMMERHAKTVFAGGMWVFPGGAVDHQDSPAWYADVALHRTDEEASRLLALDEGGLAYYMAAVRETFEEAGVLLALHREDESLLQIPPDAEARFNDYRDRLNSGKLEFKHILETEGLLADVGQMHYIARWITPLGSPRRFDARFFIARFPQNQHPLHDDHELVNSAWLAPREILRLFEAGEMAMISPTLRMIRNLAPFSSSAEVIASLSHDLPWESVRVHRDTGDVIMPGEDGYDDGLEDVESGWVRLRKR